MITIIMPAYNEEKYIENAINSVLKQSYREFELIIINDGSTDCTADIVNKLKEDDDRIKFINPGKKVGKVAGYNIASSMASGDWFYFMGADDEMPIDALKKWHDATKGLDANEKIAIRGRMKVISENKKYDGLILPKNKKRMNYSGPLTLLSKGMHDFIIPIPENLPNEDTWWGLCIRFFGEKQIAIDDIIAYYRIHNNNSISRNSTFLNFSEKYHIRFNARKYFIEYFKNQLTDKEIDELENEIKCEEYRYNGKLLKIIFYKKISLFYKIRMIVFSNKLLYRIKIHFDRYMFGH